MHLIGQHSRVESKYTLEFFIGSGPEPTAKVRRRVQTSDADRSKKIGGAIEIETAVIKSSAELAAFSVWPQYFGKLSLRTTTQKGPKADRMASTLNGLV